MELQALISGYLALQGFALAGTPLALAWLRHLPSRGYAIAKPLGLLFSGVILWWGATLRLWPATAAAALAAALALLAGGLFALRGQWDAVASWWREHRRFVLITELLFAAAFVAWA
ncbi:MAG: hypothetical protein KBH71_03195, partial [Anaerolineae bacterium]|nr:hypothetical protein [Anaerolineae bacterium]